MLLLLLLLVVVVVPFIDNCYSGRMVVAVVGRLSHGRDNAAAAALKNVADLLLLLLLLLLLMLLQTDGCSRGSRCESGGEV